jgi:hypothetical protein
MSRFGVFMILGMLRIGGEYVKFCWKEVKDF